MLAADGVVKVLDFGVGLRGKFFSARHKLDKSECVIIFQHEKEDLIDWAQCELIVSTDLAKDKNAIKIRFDSDMNDRLFDLYLNLFQTKTWSITESNELLETLNAHTMYYGLDISEEIHSHQILDSYGKLRGLVFKKPKGTMMCPPMAPLNLPEWDKPHDHLPLFGTIDQVISIVGKEPDTIVQNEAIYFLDDQNQIALRFLVNDVTSNKRVDLPYVKYILKGHDVTADLIHQRDVVGYLLQAINILFLLTSMPIQLHKIHPFIQEWIKIAGKNHKYNISGMTNPVLPLMKTEEDFFRYWVKICPDMIDLEAMKILVPSKAFKDKLVDHLQHFTSIYEGEEIVIPTVLVGTTLDMVDSSQDLLLTSRTFPIYKTIKTDPEQSIIHTKLLETYNLQTTPYYFITEDERTILVQNASTYIEALVISYEWYNEYRNSKLDLREEEKFDILLLPHILYTISPKGTLQIIENNTRDEPEYVHILRYHNEKYAALLIL